MYVKLRPYLLETLEKLKESFELILFTAGSAEYAEVILSTFNGQDYFDHILSREHCIKVHKNNVLIKDMSLLLNGRDIKDILIIDLVPRFLTLFELVRHIACNAVSGACEMEHHHEHPIPKIDSNTQSFPHGWSELFHGDSSDHKGVR